MNPLFLSLKEWMTKTNTSISQTARLLNVSPSLVHFWFAGKRRQTSPEIAEKIKNLISANAENKGSENKSKADELFEIAISEIADAIKSLCWKLYYFCQNANANDIPKLRQRIGENTFFFFIQLVRAITSKKALEIVKQENEKFFKGGD